MGTVRAKFKCLQVNNTEHTKEVNLAAVYDQSEDNKDFTNATPNGNLNITIRNDAPASEFFKPGKFYFMDFTEAEQS